MQSARQQGQRHANARGQGRLAGAQGAQEGGQHQGDFSGQARVAVAVSPIGDRRQTGHTGNQAGQKQRTAKKEADRAAERGHGKGAQPRRPGAIDTLAALPLRPDEQTDAEGGGEAKDGRVQRISLTECAPEKLGARMGSEH